ncbi:MAG: hypothetical protein AAF387_14915 [Pseudomonadota bacterium]
MKTIIRVFTLGILSLCAVHSHAGTVDLTNFPELTSDTVMRTDSGVT